MKILKKKGIEHYENLICTDCELKITDFRDKTMTRSSVANSPPDLRCLAFVTSRLTGK
jgi:hypothetical protein